MIEARFTSDEKQKKLSLSVKGHAGYAEYGKDTICASASILAYTVAQIISAMWRHGDLAKDPTIRLDPGDIEISCEVEKKTVYAEAVHTFFVAEVGYTLLAYNHPEYVTISNTLGKDL